MIILEKRNEIYNQIGQKIKKYRKEKKLTQVDLAEKLDISISYLSKIEAKNCRKSFSLDLLVNIAETLEIDIKDFFD
ncbi:helix-turn-helix domain-containing protein [Halanaerobium congolense]|uniref:helix-turn-helix domain-containing protein n=1 Tax=Halanaerobium congolense TaxID=54121 RepID=UPI0035935E0D